jgi:pimeloyl-ACP methyl ester carboxylesterase
VLATLGVERAHVVGVSYSAAVALQVAVTAPARVHSLTVIEPPPVHIPSADQFVAANTQFIDDYRTHGAITAVDRFLIRVIGPDWRGDLESHVPGALQQVERDADTFFGTDLPALLSWRFGAEDARRIHQPVLYIGGSESGPWFAEVRELILAWLPHSEDVVIAGADHSLAATHPAQIATGLAAFMHRHPMSR